MAETLSRFSIISFIAAGVFLLLAIVLFFYFRIPTVIGDLTGKNAKKTIARMRENNEKSGSKVRPSNNKGSREKRTGSDTKKETAVAARSAPDEGGMPETGLLKDNQASVLGESTVMLENTEQTALLPDALQDAAPKVSSVKITMIEEIIYIHTQEVIL